MQGGFNHSCRSLIDYLITTYVQQLTIGESWAFHWHPQPIPEGKTFGVQAIDTSEKSSITCWN